MNAQMLFIVCFSASLAAVGIEILKKLGLEDGAGAGDILIALAQYLVKALVDEVVKMLPEHSKASEGAEAAAQEADDEERTKREGDVLAEVKKLAARMDEIEKRTAPTAIAAAVRAAQAAASLNRAQTRSAALGAPALPVPQANNTKTQAKSILNRLRQRDPAGRLSDAGCAAQLTSSIRRSRAVTSAVSVSLCRATPTTPRQRAF